MFLVRSRTRGDVSKSLDRISLLPRTSTVPAEPWLPLARVLVRALLPEVKVVYTVDALGLPTYTAPDDVPLA